MGTKVLKVAVTQGKKILEQKLISSRTSVTVGTAASNTLHVSGEGLPNTYNLFEVVGGKYCLNFTEKMTGKVNVGAGQLDFETARQQTGVRKRGNEYQMVLSEASKGAIELGAGGVRVIFQFVDAPADAVPAKLADSTYMPPLQRLDRVFWVCLFISALLHTGGVIGAMKAEPPPKRTLSQIPDRFAKMIIKKPLKEEPKKEEKKPKPKKDGEKKPSDKKAEKKDKPKAEKKPDKKPVTAAKKAEKRAVARAKVRQSAVFKALAIATSGGGAGTVFQNDGDPQTNVSAALAASGGAGIAAADGGPGGPAVRGGSGGGGPVAIGKVGDVAVGGGGGKITNRRGPKIRVNVTLSRPKIEDGDLSGKTVARKIRARKRAFQACYERELKRNPSLKGKLVLEVTVGENGRVADIVVDSNALNNAVANCIKGKMRSIRFPVPKDSDGEPSEATFSYPFVFASSG